MVAGPDRTSNINSGTNPYTLTVLVSIVLVCFVNTYHPSPQSTQYNKPKILNDSIHTKNLLSLSTQNEAC